MGAGWREVSWILKSMYTMTMRVASSRVLRNDIESFFKVRLSAAHVFMVCSWKPGSPATRAWS